MLCQLVGGCAGLMMDLVAYVKLGAVGSKHMISSLQVVFLSASAQAVALLEGSLGHNISGSPVTDSNGTFEHCAGA